MANQDYLGWVAIIMPKLKEMNNVEMQKMNSVAKT